MDEDDSRIVPETGIRHDYANHWPLFGISDDLDETHEEWIELTTDLRECPIGKYSVLYARYPNLITDQNRTSVKRLDELADLVNIRVANSDPFTPQEARIIRDEVTRLIYGSTAPPGQRTLVIKATDHI